VAAYFCKDKTLLIQQRGERNCRSEHSPGLARRSPLTGSGRTLVPSQSIPRAASPGALVSLSAPLPARRWVFAVQCAPWCGSTQQPITSLVPQKWGDPSELTPRRALTPPTPAWPCHPPPHPPTISSPAEQPGLTHLSWPDVPSQSWPLVAPAAG